MKNFYKILVVFATFISSSAWAVDPVYTTFFSNQAIKGYDTVAYFTEGKPVKGNAQFSTEYNGAEWLFSKQEHLDLFTQNPEKYAPQYGGYCAWAVSQNKTASIEPDLFTVVNDKLYLNYSKSVNEKWQANKHNFIVDADKNWPNLVD